MPQISSHNLSLDEIKLLLVGYPGTGKTVGYGSWAKLGELFIYDWDHRTKPLKKFFSDLPISYESFRSDEFSRFRDHLLSLADALISDSMESHLRNFEFPKRPPVTASIDSLTALSYSMMQYLLSFRKSRKADPETQTVKGEEVVRRMGVIDIPSMPEWLGESQGMIQIVDLIKKLPCNFVLTAHYAQALDVGGTAGGKIGAVGKKTVITIGSKIANIIPGLFDEIWTTYTQQGINSTDPLKYMIRTQPYSDEMGKTCLPISPEIDFTYPTTLYDAVKSDIERK